MSRTLTNARAIIRQFTRNGASSGTYTNTDIDWAFQTVADDLLRATSAVRTITTATALVAADATVTGFASNFHPDRRVGTWYLTDSTGLRSEIKVVGMNEIIDLFTRNGVAATGRPKKVAFASETTGTLFPIADAAYTFTYEYVPPFTTWTPGTAVAATGVATVTGAGAIAIALTNPGAYDTAPTIAIGAGTATATCVLNTATHGVGTITIAGTNSGYASSPTITFSGGTDVTFNLRDDYLNPIFMGAAAKLQLHEPENAAHARARWADYLAFRNSMRGMGGHGDSSIQGQRGPW